MNISALFARIWTLGERPFTLERRDRVDLGKTVEPRSLQKEGVTNDSAERSWTKPSAERLCNQCLCKNKVWPRPLKKDYATKASAERKCNQCFLTGRKCKVEWFASETRLCGNRNRYSVPLLGCYCEPFSYTAKYSQRSSRLKSVLKNIK